MNLGGPPLCLTTRNQLRGVDKTARFGTSDKDCPELVRARPRSRSEYVLFEPWLRARPLTARARGRRFSRAFCGGGGRGLRVLGEVIRGLLGRAANLLVYLRTHRILV
jgi:hypothetical protein